MLQKKIYVKKNDSIFDPIYNLIEYANNCSKPIIISSEEENQALNKIKEDLNSDSLNDYNLSLKKMIFKDIPDFFTSSQKVFLQQYHKEIFDNKIISYIERPDNIDFGYKRMIGIKRHSKNYLLMEKKQITEKVKDKKKVEKKENKDDKNNILSLNEEKY